MCNARSNARRTSNDRRIVGLRRVFTARHYLVVGIVALLALHPHAQGRSFIWKATAKSGGTIYLIGSVHLLSEKYYPLAPAFDPAFGTADLLVEELDLGDMASPDSQMLMLSKGMLQGNQSLDTVLSPETFKAVT